MQLHGSGKGIIIPTKQLVVLYIGGVEGWRGENIRTYMQRLSVSDSPQKNRAEYQHNCVPERCIQRHTTLICRVVLATINQKKNSTS